MAHEHIVYMMLTDAAAQLEDLESIYRYLSLLEPLVKRDDHRPYLAIAHRARGIAHRLEAEYDEASVQLNKALEIFQEFGAAWQKGRTYCQLADLALVQTDPTAAQENYLLALKEFEQVQALPDLKKTRQALEAIESRM